jgi:carbamoyltransferase
LETLIIMPDEYLLGISAYYHDSAACLLKNGEVFAAAQEERFTRKKHDSRFPKSAIDYCLSEAKITVDDISHVIFYDKPLVKFERLLETYLAYAPKGLISFFSAMPIWLKEKLFLKSTLQKNSKQFLQRKNFQNSYSRNTTKLMLLLHFL